MNSLKIVLIIIIWFLIDVTSVAQDTTLTTIELKEYVVKPYIESRPDGHAPSGVMAAHTHDDGVWMFAYQGMLMNMKGNIKGLGSISDENVFANYNVAPQSMIMQMLSVMYGVNMRLTLMAMFNYLDKQMKLSTEMGEEFNTHSSGIGDIVPSILYDLVEFKRQKIIANLGLQIPTGSISKRDDTPMKEESKLPYPMQMSSGTYDIVAKLTYVGQDEQTSWGIQSSNYIRTGENKEGYRLGNQYQVSVWLAMPIIQSLSSSIRIEGTKVESICGKDDELISMMAPATNVSNFGREVLDTYLGLNYYIANGKFKESRITLEYGIPIYQHVNGIQMPVISNFILTIQLQNTK